MHGMRSWSAAGVVLMLAAVGCAGGERDASAAEARETRVAHASMTARLSAPKPPPPPMTAADSAAARTRIAVLADSARAGFARGTRLGAREVGNLRRDVNAQQVATAERLGIRAGSDARTKQLLREGRLVALGDSTAWWVLRDMDHSVPYVTPDARAMLVEIGRRFHARLDRLGLPRYRMKVTSALRTDETQQDLRKINTYAARTTSAHEFGTTVDVSHERFAAPAPADLRVPGAAEMEIEALAELEKEHGRVLQAELGRVILEMREAGALHVMMENQQPVYHMTVARRF